MTAVGLAIEATQPREGGMVWLKWYLLAIATTVSGLLVTGSDTIPRMLAGLAILAIGGAAIVRFDLIHPYTWYGLPFFVYSASTPVLVWLGKASSRGDLHQVVLLEWIALAVFLAVVGPRSYQMRVRSMTPGIGLPARALFLGSLLVSAGFTAAAWFGGYRTKFDILQSESLWLKLSSAFPVLAFAFAAMAMKTLLDRRRIPWLLVTFVVAWMSVAFLVTGERDFVIRVLLIAAVLIHVLWRRIGSVRFLVLLAVGFVLVPILADLKNALISESTAQVKTQELVIRALSDEPVSASRNLDVLLHQTDVRGRFGGITLWWDIRRMFLPSSFFPEADDPTTWFNRTFYRRVVARGGGEGFTLVGEGYMNFGALGVILWFAGLGAFARLLYARGSRSPTWLLVYVTTMPIIIYVTRADLGNLLAQFTKHVLLPLGAILAMRMLSRRRGSLSPGGAS